MLALFALFALAAVDLDHDGLDDQLEARLLAQFRPRLHVSRTDCDGLPAEFGLKGVVSRNGTLYGQAFPARLAGREFVELHYFHLWGRDCGRVGHKLDAEHVSALLAPDGAGGWRAVYWLATGHGGTPCNSDNAARAAQLGGEHSGPNVWASYGKHASFLTRDLCNKSPCDGDVCRDMIEVPAAPVVNLGQAGALFPGLEWVDSLSWGLGKKMGPDFTPQLFARLEKLPVQPASVSGGVEPVTSVWLAGSETIGAVDTAGSHTRNALGTAEKKSAGGLRRAWRSTRGFLGGK
jgi:hypothetical protein